MKRVVEQIKKKKEIRKLDPYLTGANLFLFTNLNPFKLSMLLEKGKIKITAKSGDIAAFDVVVPEGNTGQPPGPIISQLNGAGLPTRIQGGSVWVSKDTLAVRKGEIISEILAPILTKLGIKPVEAGLELKVAYEDGLIIPKEQLSVDLNETKKNIQKAYFTGFSLSTDIVYPTQENIKTLIQTAIEETYMIAMGATIPTKETITDLIVKTYLETHRIKLSLEPITS